MSNLSLQSAQKAVPGTKIVATTYPDGVKGVEHSLDQVAQRIRAGRIDPRVRSWAIRTLKAAGNPKGVFDQARALLAGFKKATIYVQDPINAEYIQAAQETLCLDDKGYCFKGGDCDDLTTALASAMMSVGITAYIVGQAFNNEALPTHVLFAVEDTATHERWRVDPSTDYDVGGYSPKMTKEWWIDPMSGKPATIDSAEIVQGTPPPDFIGIGATPKAGLGAPNALVGVTDAVYTGITTQIQAAYRAITDSTDRLEAAVNEVEQTRMIFRPDIPFDPEPTITISSLADFPTGGTWTASMSVISHDLISTGRLFERALSDALTGARSIYVDVQNMEAYIGATAADQTRYQIIARGVTDSIIGIFSPTGAVLGGIATKLGSILSPAQVTQAQTDQTNGKPTGLSAAPIAFIAGATAAVVVTLAVVYAFVKFQDAAVSIAKETTKQDTLRFASLMVQENKWTADQAAAFINQQSVIRVAEEQAKAAQNKNDPFANTFESVGKIFMWAAIGGATILGIVTFGPLIKNLGEDYRETRRARLHPASAPTSTPQT